MLAVVAALRPLVAQIKQLERQIPTAVREHPDGEIFLSLFEDPNSVITAARLLYAIGDCRARSRPAMRLPLAPARPRSQSSPANAKAACFGWGGNKRLRCSFGPERSQPEWTTPGGTAVSSSARYATTSPNAIMDERKACGLTIVSQQRLQQKPLAYFKIFALAWGRTPQPGFGPQAIESPMTSS